MNFFTEGLEINCNLFLYNTRYYVIACKLTKIQCECQFENNIRVTVLCSTNRISNRNFPILHIINLLNKKIL